MSDIPCCALHIAQQGKKSGCAVENLAGTNGEIGCGHCPPLHMHGRWGSGYAVENLAGPNGEIGSGHCPPLHMHGRDNCSHRFVRNVGDVTPIPVAKLNLWSV